MTVITRHIRVMLTEAQRLALAADSLEGVDHEYLIAAAAPMNSRFAMLERAAGLAEHAAAELRDEMAKLSGWCDPS